VDIVKSLETTLTILNHKLKQGVVWNAITSEFPSREFVWGELNQAGPTY